LPDLKREQAFAESAAIRSADDAGGDAAGAASAPDGRAWSIPVMCLGLGMLAALLVIPQVDQNRQLVRQVARLEVDLAHLEAQADANRQFIQRLSSDPVMIERIAQRQMNLIREGTEALRLDNDPAALDRSPFSLSKLPPPPPLEEERTIGGRLAALARHPSLQPWLLGVSIMVIATGLVLGATPRRPRE